MTERSSSETGGTARRDFILRCAGAVAAVVVVATALPGYLGRRAWQAARSFRRIKPLRRDELYRPHDLAG